MERISADLCVIGGGAAGLSVAAGASRMGARTVLVEGGRMGGDCLNYGCVPSKSLIAAAQVAHTVRTAAGFGVAAGEPVVDLRQVRRHVRQVIDAIAPHDSEARFQGLGCTVLRAPGRFLDERHLHAGDVIVRARRYVVATGSRPAVPPIPGLAETEPFTNETIFDNDQPVAHLIVIGAGPVGCEIAQAYRRLGSRVTVIDRGRMLPRDDDESVAVLRSVFAEEGIAVLENSDVVAIGGGPNRPVITVARDGTHLSIEGSRVLVATGRRPNIEDLGLEAAGIAHSPAGIAVDARLRTSNPRIFAIGDVVEGGLHFTHVAGYQAGIVLRNCLFRWPARASDTALPWVTFTDPEVAQVGMTESQARRQFGEIRILRARFADNDRARTEGREDGLIKVATTPRGRILGASIVGPRAGEVLAPWILAINEGLGIAALARAVAPYPTLGEVGRRAAGEFFIPSLFGRNTRRLVRLLSRLG